MTIPASGVSTDSCRYFGQNAPGQNQTGFHTIGVEHVLFGYLTRMSMDKSLCVSDISNPLDPLCII